MKAPKHFSWEMQETYEKHFDMIHRIYVEALRRAEMDSDSNFEDFKTVRAEVFQGVYGTMMVLCYTNVIDCKWPDMVTLLDAYEEDMEVFA